MSTLKCLPSTVSSYNFAMLHSLSCPCNNSHCFNLDGFYFRFISLEQLSHMGPPYSRTGLTKDVGLYILSREALSSLNAVYALSCLLYFLANHSPAKLQT